MIKQFYHTIPAELKALLKDAKIDNIKEIGKATDSMDLAQN